MYQRPSKLPGLFYHVTHRDMFYLKNLSILKKVPSNLSCFLSLIILAICTPLFRCIQQTTISRDANEGGKHTDPERIIKNQNSLGGGEELFFMYCFWQTTDCSKYLGINSLDMFHLAHTMFCVSLPRHFLLVANISKLGHYRQEYRFLVFLEKSEALATQAWINPTQQ